MYIVTCMCIIKAFSKLLKEKNENIFVLKRLWGNNAT